MLFLTIVFGIVFGSQVYSALKLFIFPKYYKGFYCLKFGLWLMCVVFDGVVIYKLWWMLFVIGVLHLVIFICVINRDNGDYLSTPLHPKSKRKEK